MKKYSQKSKGISKVVLEYIDEIGGQNLLSEVTDSLEKQLDESAKTNEILVTSPVNLSKTQLKDIQLAIQKIHNLKLPVVNHIDKNIIGGFTIRVGDWYLDSSINNELEQLKRLMLQ